MNSLHRQVLVVDDDADIRWALRTLLNSEGLEVIEATNGRMALEMIHLASPAPDLVLLDNRMPDISGEEVLRKTRETDSSPPVIMITGFGTPEHARQMMCAGAFCYLFKPLDHRKVLDAVREAMDLVRPHGRPAKAGQAGGGSGSLLSIMGQSEAIQAIEARVEMVNGTDYSVLLVGESGSGKEVVARAIHERSSKSHLEMVAKDCGSIPESLIESELFGHEKGAFTGADRLVKGMFEVAAGSTLFLDEISNLSPHMQSRLLRVLQEKYFYRVGGTTSIKTSARILAATNVDLLASRDFRKDLYYRLAEFVIEVPPLRQRRQDIMFLAQRFKEEAEKELHNKHMVFSQAAQELMMSFAWPGNVRELRNVVRGALLEATGVIEPCHLAINLNAQASRAPAPARQDMPLDTAAFQMQVGELGTSSLKRIVDSATVDIERRMIVAALTYTRGNKAGAARLLKVDYKTLHTKIKRYDIQSQGKRK